ncbi:MAG: ABC transporter substrate-binding protein [Candidatus Rokubacteria bacterium]|nr:ABC transporter substrate-binding protein [Candidatus Rokubacteria bacterium]MBI2155931.1 ABC transporter substrate-binding protein [Candidatus Rokubacteria bacterium]MBI2494129.1 ABC transporter substrate-binding protein [Candidatus Rokubacteria bacterium]
MKRLAALLVLPLLALLGVAGSALAQETYKVGAVLSITGPASYFGEDERNTLMLLQDQINARGGINGKKLEVVIYDDATDPTKSVTALKRLHEEDKVLAVIGASISGNALALIPFSEKAGVPQLVPAASGKISNPVKKWVFQFCNTDVQSIARILGFLQAKGVKKIAMLNDSTGYGVSGKEELDRQAPGKGFEVVAAETFGPNDTDMTPQLTRIKAAGARAVIVWNATPASAIVAKNFKQIGLDALQIQSTAFVSPRLLSLAGAAADGIILTGYKLPIVDQVPASDPQRKIIVEYRDAYLKRFGKEPNPFGALVHDAFTALVKVLETAGVDREKIRQGLESLKGFMGANGTYTTSATDHNGYAVESLQMLVVETGKFKPVH